MEPTNSPIRNFALHAALTLVLAALSGSALLAVTDYATRGVVV